MSDGEELEEAVRRSIYEGDCLLAVAREMKRLRGWRCSDHEARGRVSAMCSPNNHHRLQAALVAIVLDKSECDYVINVLMRIRYRRDRKIPLRRAALHEREALRARDRA